MGKLSNNSFARALKRFWGQYIYSKAETSPDSLDTAPLDDQILVQVPEEAPSKHISAATGLSVGLERGHNEDTLFCLNGNADGQEMPSNFGLYIVADGMGGHRAGEVASALSVNTVAAGLISNVFLHLFDPDSLNSDEPLQELVRVAFEDANLNVVDRVPGGGTTLTVAMLLGNQITIGHVGDSRAYLISKDEIHLLTRDHSLVERLRELGQLSAEEAAVHPQRNVLYRAIGQGANLEVDVLSHPIPNASYLLICSDGLWSVVNDTEIQSIILHSSDLQQACDELVQAANNAGGPDNISTVLVHFPPA